MNGDGTPRKHGRQRYASLRGHESPGSTYGVFSSHICVYICFGVPQRITSMRDLFLASVDLYQPPARPRPPLTEPTVLPSMVLSPRPSRMQSEWAYTTLCAPEHAKTQAGSLLFSVALAPLKHLSLPLRLYFDLPPFKYSYVFVCHSSTQDTLAERSKALAPGASPQGRGFEPHRCHSPLKKVLRS